MNLCLGHQKPSSDKRRRARAGGVVTGCWNGGGEKEEEKQVEMCKCEGQAPDLADVKVLQEHERLSRGVVDLKETAGLTENGPNELSAIVMEPVGGAGAWRYLKVHGLLWDDLRPAPATTMRSQRLGQ